MSYIRQLSHDRPRARRDDNFLPDRELERKFDEAMSRRWEFARFPMTATTVTWTTVMESAPTTAITANEVNATTLTTTTSTRLGVLRLRGD